MFKTFVCTLLVSTAAFAQNSSTTETVVTNNSQEAQAVLAATQTSTAAAPSEKSALHLTLGSENSLAESDSRQFSSKAPVMSYNWVGAKYILNPRWTFKLEQNFQAASNKENISSVRTKALHDNAVEMGDLMVSALANIDKNILGSSSMSVDARYYAPTNHLSQENKELGRLRSDTKINWTLNPSWTMTAYFTARALFKSKGAVVDAENGSVSEYYQLILAPIATYNFNDNLSAYYANFTNLKSTVAQSGIWRADANNSTTHELGASYTFGSFTVNPALTSDTSLNDGSGALFASSSRAFSYETLGYNLNLYATF